MNICHRCGNQVEPNEYECPHCHCVVIGGVTVPAPRHTSAVTGVYTPELNAAIKRVVAEKGRHEDPTQA